MMKNTDDGWIEGIHEVLRDAGNEGPSLRDAVLSRIGGRTPGELAEARFEGAMRRACAGAAIVLLLLGTLALLVPGRGAESTLAEGHSLSAVGEGLAAGRAGIDALVSIETAMPWIETYTDERALLAALFAEEMTP